MTPPTCGLVLTPQRLVAVVLRPGGEARRLVRAALSDDARYGLVEYLSATGAENRGHGRARSRRPRRPPRRSRRPRRLGCPDALATAITRAAAITAPVRVATVLARLPRSRSCAPSFADSPPPASHGRCHSCDHVHHAAARRSRIGVVDTNQPVCDSINQRERQQEPALNREQSIFRSGRQNASERFVTNGAAHAAAAWARRPPRRQLSLRQLNSCHIVQRRSCSDYRVQGILEAPMKEAQGLSIGTLSRLAGVNVETVRYYERIGVMPSPARSASGYRLYTGEHSRRLGFIRRARQLGFSLDDIRGLLELVDGHTYTCAEVHALTVGHLGESIFNSLLMWNDLSTARVFFA